MSYLTRRLADLEFPVYFSFYAEPGYNNSLLTSYGFTGEWGLFKGKHQPRPDWIQLEWKYDNLSIKGNLREGFDLTVVLLCVQISGWEASLMFWMFSTA